MRRCLDLVCEQFLGSRGRVTYHDLLRDPCVTGMMERDDFFWSPESATRDRQLRLLDQHFGETPPPYYTIPPTTIGGLFQVPVFVQLLNGITEYKLKHRLHFMWY